MPARMPAAGVALAATGVAHFVKPQVFDSITATAFPDDPRRYTYINGGIETALGIGLVVPRTRRIATVGVLGYLVYLLLNAVRARR